MPWKAINENRAMFIKNGFLPEKVPFYDPSRMVASTVSPVLSLWENLVLEGKFSQMFKNAMEHDDHRDKVNGKPTIPLARFSSKTDDKEPKKITKRPPTKKKSKRKGRGDDDDTDDDTEDDEDENDEDNEDGEDSEDNNDDEDGEDGEDDEEEQPARKRKKLSKPTGKGKGNADHPSQRKKAGRSSKKPSKKPKQSGREPTPEGYQPHDTDVPAANTLGDFVLDMNITDPSFNSVFNFMKLVKVGN